MRKVTLPVLALLSLMVLMVPLAQATEPLDACGPTSLEVWLEIDAITIEPFNGEMLRIESRVIILNVGEHVAHIGWVYETLESKSWHEPWTWLMQAGILEPDHFIDPGQTDEVPFDIGISPVPDAKALRLLIEVELLNHPTGLRVFHYRESFELPEL